MGLSDGEANGVASSARTGPAIPLFSFILFHWANEPQKRWLRWALSAAFSIVLVLPVLGLLTSKH
jgi:hypothetical protein